MVVVDGVGASSLASRAARELRRAEGEPIPKSIPKGRPKSAAVGRVVGGGGVKMRSRRGVKSLGVVAVSSLMRWAMASITFLARLGERR